MSALPAALGATALLSGLAGTVTYGIIGRSARIFGPSVYRGPGLRRSIALTFDDGPSPATPHLLDYLASENIRATFFQCGMNVERNPAIARAVLAAGHDVGNHTYSHPHLYLKSPAFIDREITQAQDVINQHLGTAPTLLRAPYGQRWFGIGVVQKRLGLLGVMWTVIGQDWRWQAERVAALVVQKASPGGIVCMHDGRGVQPNPDVRNMLEAVKRIVPVLRDQGYGFEPVTTLLKSS
jgi:peptidoglycan/xylan/chitin deacetylase (PgdA/CDA1 family)